MKQGQGLVEYALIIVLVSIAVMTILGLSWYGVIGNVFTTITNTLG